MRIAITSRFQNSYFSGSTPQNSILLGKLLQKLGHDVVLLKLKEDPDWFIDIAEEAKHCPPCVTWDESSTQQYDLVVEVTWNLPTEKRPAVAKRIALFQHYAPVFYDMESSVYHFNPQRRDFTNLTEIWTWDHFDKQDIRYLEFLSGKAVYQIPYMHNFDAVDAYCKEAQVPSWFQGAMSMDARVTGEIPPTMSWSARILESNMSNTSHCLVPLNIVSEIRRVDPIRFSVHNGEHVFKNAFFQSNVAKNLILPDASGNFIPRIRLPDLCREKSLIIAHQRFRPIKGFLVDAMYLGIPVLHNCDMLKGFGYRYELNQIQDAVKQWTMIKSDYMNRRGYFAENAVTLRKMLLRKRFSLDNGIQAMKTILESQPDQMPQILTQILPPTLKIEELPGKELRVAFCDMWDQFQPEHNFFMSLLKWAGAQNDFTVKVNYDTPNLVIFGPFGESHKRYTGVPKVFFTGENQPPNKDTDTFLNLGYQYSTDPTYIRLPLWVLEINWFNEDPNKIVNPRPVPLSACMKQDPAVLDVKKKFCAFVATNPKCQNRNIAFHILNQWRGVDAGGRLFCNLPMGPIPAGLGGGGGELAKVDFYKQYKYAITYENESSPGYTTEKIFHAKVAGCVPIYWGDKYVDRDFDQGGFINACSVATPQELIDLIEKVENDPELWRKMAEVPALSEHKRQWCQHTMQEIVNQISQKLFQKKCVFTDAAWKLPGIEPTVANLEKIVAESREKRIVTAANKRFIPSALNLIQSVRQVEKDVPIYVYVWPDVQEEDKEKLCSTGATVETFPVEQPLGFSDFWEPQHFAWKLWIHAEQNRLAPTNSLVLYMDAGIDVVHPLKQIWNQIQTQGMCLFDDAEQINRRWCHPTFCKELQVTEEELAANQIWAGCMGFVAGGVYSESVIKKALDLAKKREVISGDKWKPYSSTCFGHRHDQSILSILTLRAKVPRMLLRDIYCDKARRTAENWGTPLYVHRGNPRMLAPVAPGIDEAYVINLEHRKDRLEKFKQNPNMKDIAYIWKATDGRKLNMNAGLAQLFRDNDFRWKKSVIGCAISHMGLWEKLANDPLAKSYLIMEDDVRFSQDWLAKWMTAAQHIPADTDVIYLGGVLPPNKPALPAITEAVNPYFAKVAKNSLFGGGAPRRYFHFCNYSYILTQTGAQKLIRLIQQKGIFTSGDHMIVNHGDSYLNLYFTTPLLTDCIQEDDPVYQKSEFNNFNRVDSFDSDIWNNVECFTQAEITAALAEDMRKIDIKVVNEPISEDELKRLNEEHARKLAAEEMGQSTQPSSQSQQPTLSKEETLNLWNTFLRSVATRKSEEVSSLLTQILALWANEARVKEDTQWFRVFEKLITTNHPEIQNHKATIVEFLQKYGAADVWNGIKTHLNIQIQTQTHTSEGVIIYQLAGGDPLTNMLEKEWIETLFGPITIKTVALMNELLAEKSTPILMYQNPGGKDMSGILHQIVNVFGNQGRQLILLHLSDEFARNDISMYEHKAVKHVFRNYWRPNLSKEKVTVLPLGYAKERGASVPIPSFSERKNVWSFVGSEDRLGRSEAIQTLRSLQPHQVQTKRTFGDANVLNSTQYNELLKQTRFVPCMKGHTALESFRMYEALEQGAIPFYIPSESHQCADEYKELFGNHPLLAIPSWAEAVNVLRHLSEKPEIMEKHRQVCMEWWKQQKQAFKIKISNILN